MKRNDISYQSAALGYKLITLYGERKDNSPIAARLSACDGNRFKELKIDSQNTPLWGLASAHLPLDNDGTATSSISAEQGGMISGNRQGCKFLRK